MIAEDHVRRLPLQNERVTNSSKATRSAGEMLIPALDSTRMVLYCLCAVDER